MARVGKTVAAIAKLLADELDVVQELRAQRVALQKELNALAAEIASLKGAGIGVSAKVGRKGKRSGKRRGRPPGHRGKGLKAVVVEILTKAGNPLRAGEIASKLAETGYKTSSSDPRNMVSATLAQGKQFKRVRRGLYALKK